MGAKTWMMVLSDGSARDALAARPRLEPDATRALAATLFPGERLLPVGDGDLSQTSPPDDEALVGCFAGVAVVAAHELALEHPSRLSPRFLAAGGVGTVTLHAMHSVVDWFAYAQWRAGRLVRSLSLSPERGLLEDLGPRLPFEGPYWSGQHPAAAAEDLPPRYPFPFHPLDLADAALRALFGYALEGDDDGTLFEPDCIALVRYRRSRSRWRFR